MKFWPSSKSPKLTLGTMDPGLPLLSRNVVLPAQYVSAHKHVIGVSKMGKSKLLEALFLQLMEQDIGASFVDPHGDSSLNILAILIKRGFFKDKENYKRFLYVEFLEDGHFLPFNILKIHQDEQGQPRQIPSRLASMVVEAFHRCWPALDQGAAPRFDDIMKKGLQVLIYNKLPITCMTNLLTDKSYRDALLMNVPDQDVVSFFTNRFDRWDAREATMMIESTLTRISLLTDSPVLKCSLGQQDNILDFREIMDKGIFVLYNLSSVQDEDAQRFLGCLLTRGYEVAAKSRAGILAHLRRNHQFIFDEFHRFAAQSGTALESGLSELRKFEFYQTMAHQTYSQASPSLRGALQNAEVRLVFRVSHDDAVYLSSIIGDVDPTKTKKEEVHINFTGIPEHQPMKNFLELSAQEKAWAKSLENMPRRHAYLKILGQAGTTQFKNVTLPSTRDVAQAELDKVRREFKLRLMKARDDITLPHHNNQVPQLPTASNQVNQPTAYLQAYGQYEQLKDDVVNHK
jgi:hypothetical protein